MNQLLTHGIHARSQEVAVQPAGVAAASEVATQPQATLFARVRRYVQPAVIVALAVALIITMAFTFAP